MGTKLTYILKIREHICNLSKKISYKELVIKTIKWFASIIHIKYYVTFHEYLDKLNIFKLKGGQEEKKRGGGGK